MVHLFRRYLRCGRIEPGSLARALYLVHLLEIFVRAKATALPRCGGYRLHTYILWDSVMEASKVEPLIYPSSFIVGRLVDESQDDGSHSQRRPRLRLAVE